MKEQDEERSPEKPVDPSSPDFEFLGVKRKEWGRAFQAAFDADERAKEAEAKKAAADAQLSDAMRDLDAARRDAEEKNEDAAIAEARRNAAKKAIDEALSREERERRKTEAEKATADAEEARRVADEAKAAVATKENTINGVLKNDFAAKVADADNLRFVASKMAEEAKIVELPGILERRGRLELIAKEQAELQLLINARRGVKKIVCRNCRFWEPDTPNLGTCHVRPVSNRTEPVSADSWCSMGETLPETDAALPRPPCG